ncbi:MAG: SpoVA/SpoVAEb family sporulation membrane protein [Ruminococcus sp.]|nr:SpoVA/SpoVAEb family sporulation membrane protein [Ruminococcus sp.]
MSITPQAYKAMSDKASPKSNTKVNVALAFLTGGGICVAGQLLREFFTALGYSEETAGGWTSVVLVIVSAMLTGAGIYQRLAKHAGAGTLMPITGFANAISSSAVESSSEGWVLGIGAKIFTIAGPVILYGCAASAVYGFLYYIIV